MSEELQPVAGKDPREARAQDILKLKCGVKDEKEQEKTIKEMMKYLKNKEDGVGGTTETEKHLINDAIHGPIPLTPLLYQIINTPEFHRLKDLRQLGAGHYVYPGANHTRFEHSIGVCYVAGIFARSLKQQLEMDYEKIKDDSQYNNDWYKFDEKEVMCAEIAGLCHDLGHGPLSHMFEKVIKECLKVKVEQEDLVKHENLSVAIFQRILTNPNVLGEFVNEGLDADHVELIGHMINPPDECGNRDRLFLYEIVANKLTGIDVDKWDYYQRDCHYLGILQDFQWRRTMLLGRIVMTHEGEQKLHIGFRDKEMSNLYGMFRTRANIHQKACQHKTIKAVEKMIIDAMELVQDLKIVWVDKRGGFQAIKEVVDCAIKQELDGYLAMTDSIVGHIMCADPERETDESKKQRLAKAKELLKRIERRDLYACLIKKRVPEFISLFKFLDQSSDHYSPSKEFYKASVENNLNLKAAKKLCDHEDHDRSERKKFEKMVYQHLKVAQPPIEITEDDIWVEVVKIKHISEEENNPINTVHFFEKPEKPDDLPKVLEKKEAIKRASMLVIPQAFVEYELRIYDKRCKGKRQKGDQEVFKAAMNDTWKESEVTVATVS